MMADFILAIQDWQRVFHDRIAFDLRALHEGGSWAAFLTLAGAGFVYGILHAAGPGHGKMVVGAYMMADDRTLKRGLTIVGLSALMQALVAIVLVLVVFYGLGLARDKAEYAAAWLECASYGLIGLVGTVLVVRGLRAFDGHVHDEHCGHAHGPDARALAQVHDFRTMAMMVLSIGIRPCSGALLLMFFACLLGEVWAGMGAVLAMGVGTGITTGVIAVAAAHSRRGILKLAGASDRVLARVGGVLSILCGAAIITFAALFIQAAWPSAPQSAYQHPLMGRR